MGRVSDDMTALRQEHEQAVRSLGGRLSRLEERVSAAQHERVEVKGANVNGTEAGPSARQPPRREHPDIVTKEPAPDDEEVYGAARPLVNEWRGL